MITASQWLAAALGIDAECASAGRGSACSLLMSFTARNLSQEASRQVGPKVADANECVTRHHGALLVLTSGMERRTQEIGFSAISDGACDLYKDWRAQRQAAF